MVEVSAAEITLRVGPHWLQFNPTSLQGSTTPASPFHLNEDGTVAVADNQPEEMDIAAERFARELLMQTP